MTCATKVAFALLLVDLFLREGGGRLVAKLFDYFVKGAGSLRLHRGSGASFDCAHLDLKICSRLFTEEQRGKNKGRRDR